eukprot:GHVU01203493.1.p1 GENE.GHVU01203493.1~~GHVU01203493.1.p1  ORF type:complete len:223 (-),score=6.65 GHVU01203493.1:194-862(-)
MDAQCAQTPVGAVGRSYCESGQPTGQTTSVCFLTTKSVHRGTKQTNKQYVHSMATRSIIDRSVMMIECIYTEYIYLYVCMHARALRRAAHSRRIVRALSLGAFLLHNQSGHIRRPQRERDTHALTHQLLSQSSFVSVTFLSLFSPVDGLLCSGFTISPSFPLLSSLEVRAPRWPPFSSSFRFLLALLSPPRQRPPRTCKRIHLCPSVDRDKSDYIPYACFRQ